MLIQGELVLIQGELVLIQGGGANQEWKPGDLGIIWRNTELLIDRDSKGLQSKSQKHFFS